MKAIVFVDGKKNCKICNREVISEALKGVQETATKASKTKLSEQG